MQTPAALHVIQFVSVELVGIHCESEVFRTNGIIHVLQMPAELHY